MKAEEARKLALELESETSRYNDVIAKIKTLAENGHFRLITPYPGRDVIDRLCKDGYLCFDGAPTISNHAVISW
ncbi:hypothetical protein ACE38W_00570 [Chitinophaga sp. Hz27]|uniref:hypothetical protein n=1 Tax=Chitinophaga sp. Hz27 TaxID=3347169 RepID=UPI0035D651CF